MPKRSLQTGVAYHGNRMPTHVRQDMREIAKADMDIVVHMLSHTDWERHKNVMGDIFKITEDAGLEVWVDCWGLGGPPGDKSHFLAYHPEAHIYYSDGTMAPASACLNSPVYRGFVKDWVDTVASLGAKTIFWDEPHLPTRMKEGQRYYACTCPTCKKLFEEKYNRPMPLLSDPDVEAFRTDTIIDFFSEMTSYSASMGIYNAVCIMFGDHYGIGMDSLHRLCSLPTLHNIGSDPYWLNVGKPVDSYEYVYTNTAENLDICNRFKKDHNIWIQTYNNPRGCEEDIILATEAAYDAGARIILTWSYMGGESNDYHSANPERTWDLTVEAMRRIRAVERDRIWEEKRKQFIQNK